MSVSEKEFVTYSVHISDNVQTSEESYRLGCSYPVEPSSF